MINEFEKIIGVNIIKWDLLLVFELYLFMNKSKYCLIKSFEFINLVINILVLILWGNCSILNCIFLILIEIFVKY